MDVDNSASIQNAVAQLLTPSEPEQVKEEELEQGISTRKELH